MADITQISLNGSVYDLRDKKWLDSITNCITEIPQDIQLELSSGTLTLKAGSKVYVPNGAGVFDAVTTATDLTITYSGSDTLLVFLRKDGSGLSYGSVGSCVSGSTDSLAGTTYHNWYDTTNNVIHRYTNNASTPNHDCSLPLCIVTSSGGAISSIDQVFNGFGYIGSTVFSLPGVKGLIPNGRNTDGTLKNTALAVSSVKTQTSSTVGSDMVLRIYANGALFWSTSTNTYDSMTNYNKSSGVIDNSCYFGTVSTTTDGQITSFTPKQVFHALDYNDSEYIAHQAMPSDIYINMTLPASGGSITAPADGYIVLAKKSGAANEYISISGFVESLQTAYTANETLLACVPVSKGQTPKVFYNATGTTTYFKFVYANGAK